MLTPGKGAGLHLIDNGLSFARSQDEVPKEPNYWKRASEHAEGGDDKTRGPWQGSPLHPEAIRWAQSIDPQKFRDEMQKIGVPQRHSAEAMRRLVTLQQRVRPGITKAQAFMAPFTAPPSAGQDRTAPAAEGK